MPRASSVAAGLIGVGTGLGALGGHLTGVGADAGAAAGAVGGAMLGSMALMTAARNEAIREAMAEHAHAAGRHTETEPEEQIDDYTGAVVIRNPDGSSGLGIPYNGPAYPIPRGYGNQPIPHIAIPVAREHNRQFEARERRRAAVRQVLGRTMDIDSATIVRNPLRRM